jgi:hypothetical protein
MSAVSWGEYKSSIRVNARHSSVSRTINPRLQPPPPHATPLVKQ